MSVGTGTHTAPKVLMSWPVIVQPILDALNSVLVIYCMLIDSYTKSTSYVPNTLCTDVELKVHRSCTA